MSDATLAKADETLKGVFGFDAFRPGQSEVIERVLNGADTLGLMPNGAGKSLCYQLPALLLDGCVVVISPLIALMKDQIDGLPRALATSARAINSSLSPGERRRVLAALNGGRLRLVLAAPERLRQRPFLSALSRARVALFVVDEAHCVSLWGHDFRPDYLFIREVLRMLGEPPLLALTGTATATTAEDIGVELGRRLDRISTGVLRPNLHLSVEQVREARAKQGRLRRLCQYTSGSTIVYVNAQQRAEQLAEMLQKGGVAAGFYHAGLSSSERSVSQDRFMQGETRVVVTTVALGLGVDKPDVRLVVHYDPPTSLESYVQGAGRAGRDGLPASCAMLVGPRDRGGLSQWLYRERPGIDVVRAVDRALRRVQRNGFVSVAVDDLIREVEDDLDMEVDETRIRVGISVLERAGVASRDLDGPRAIEIRVVPRSASDEELRTFMHRTRLRTSQWLQLDASELVQRSGVPLGNLEAKLLDWQARGWISYRSSGYNLCVSLEPPAPDADARILRVLDALEAAQEERLRQLFTYVEAKGCRHAEIARYFGVADPEKCEACDHCARTMREAPLPFAPFLREPGASWIDRARAAVTAFLDPPRS